MRWRWCVCDMDGTLLDPRGAISPRDRAALGRLQAAGVEVVLATGRLDLMALRFAAELGVTAPLISCNGALIRDPVHRAVIHAHPLAPGAVAQVRRHLAARGQAHLVYTADRIYHTPGNPRLAKLAAYNAGARPEHRVPISPIEELDGAPPAAPPLKILVTGAAPGLAEELLSLPGAGEALAVVPSERGLLDVTAAGTSKGAGLELLGRHLGLSPADAVVFGDCHNDLSMLERCGLPIAMGNAEPEVKAAAAFVTRSNAEDGVAQAVEELLLRG